MIANLFMIKDTPQYGKGAKGLFATQFIPKGTIIYFDCKKCKKWSEEDLTKLTKKELAFQKTHDPVIRYCDERMLYNNHSCNANTLDYNGVDIVVRDIKSGEEQTEDYRVPCPEDPEDWSINFPGGCKCGAKNCMKGKGFKSPASPALKKFWGKKIKAALKVAPDVKQPLKKKLVGEHPELAYLFRK